MSKDAYEAGYDVLDFDSLQCIRYLGNGTEIPDPGIVLVDERFVPS